jgi:hypothetical protein
MIFDGSSLEIIDEVTQDTMPQLFQQTVVGRMSSRMQLHAHKLNLKGPMCQSASSFYLIFIKIFITNSVHR